MIAKLLCIYNDAKSNEYTVLCTIVMYIVMYNSDAQKWWNSTVFKESMSKWMRDPIMNSNCVFGTWLDFENRTLNSFDF